MGERRAGSRRSAGTVPGLQKGVHVNRSQLVAEAAKRSGLEEKAVDAALRGVLEVVAGVVAKGKDKVTIPGWVGFEQVSRAARKARNPQTGQPIKVPKSKSVRVTAGATLKNIAAGRVKPPAAAKAAPAAKAAKTTRSRAKTAAAAGPKKATTKPAAKTAKAAAKPRAAARTAKAAPKAKSAPKAKAKAASAPKAKKASKKK
jgi:DNA-binding protein HU-beta